MKITKEKIVYFLSLNLTPILLSIPFLILIFFLDNELYVSEKYWNILPIMVLVIFFSFISSLTALLYTFLKRNKYDMFICSLIVGIVNFIVLGIIITWLDVSSSFSLLGFLFFVIFMISLLSIPYLIILKLTDKYRKKIKW